MYSNGVSERTSFNQQFIHGNPQKYEYQLCKHFPSNSGQHFPGRPYDNFKQAPLSSLLEYKDAPQLAYKQISLYNDRTKSQVSGTVMIKFLNLLRFTSTYEDQDTILIPANEIILAEDNFLDTLIKLRLRNQAEYLFDETYKDLLSKVGLYKNDSLSSQSNSSNQQTTNSSSKANKKKEKNLDFPMSTTGAEIKIPEFIANEKQFTLGDVLSRAFATAVYVHYRNHVKEGIEFIPNSSSVFVEPEQDQLLKQKYEKVEEFFEMTNESERIKFVDRFMSIAKQAENKHKPESTYSKVSPIELTEEILQEKQTQFQNFMIQCEPDSPRGLTEFLIHNPILYLFDFKADFNKLLFENIESIVRDKIQERLIMDDLEGGKVSGGKSKNKKKKKNKNKDQQATQNSGQEEQYLLNLTPQRPTPTQTTPKTYSSTEPSSHQQEASASSPPQEEEGERDNQKKKKKKKKNKKKKNKEKKEEETADHHTSQFNPDRQDEDEKEPLLQQRTGNMFQFEFGAKNEETNLFGFKNEPISQTFSELPESSLNLGPQEELDQFRCKPWNAKPPTSSSSFQTAPQQFPDPFSRNCGPRSVREKWGARQDWGINYSNQSITNSDNYKQLGQLFAPSPPQVDEGLDIEEIQLEDKIDEDDDDDGRPDRKQYKPMDNPDEQPQLRSSNMRCGFLSKQMQLDDDDLFNNQRDEGDSLRGSEDSVKEEQHTYEILPGPEELQSDEENPIFQDIKKEVEEEKKENKEIKSSRAESQVYTSDFEDYESSEKRDDFDEDNDPLLLNFKKREDGFDRDISTTSEDELKKLLHMERFSSSEGRLSSCISVDDTRAFNDSKISIGSGKIMQRKPWGVILNKKKGDKVNLEMIIKQNQSFSFEDDKEEQKVKLDKKQITSSELNKDELQKQVEKEQNSLETLTQPEIEIEDETKKDEIEIKISAIDIEVKPSSVPVRQKDLSPAPAPSQKGSPKQSPSKQPQSPSQLPPPPASAALDQIPSNSTPTVPLKVTHPDSVTAPDSDSASTSAVESALSPELATNDTTTATPGASISTAVQRFKDPVLQTSKSHPQSKLNKSSEGEKPPDQVTFVSMEKKKKKKNKKKKGAAAAAANTNPTANANQRQDYQKYVPTQNKDEQVKPKPKFFNSKLERKQSKDQNEYHQKQKDYEFQDRRYHEKQIRNAKSPRRNDDKGHQELVYKPKRPQVNEQNEGKDNQNKNNNDRFSFLEKSKSNPEKASHSVGQNNYDQKEKGVSTFTSSGFNSQSKEHHPKAQRGHYNQRVFDQNQKKKHFQQRQSINEQEKLRLEQELYEIKQKVNETVQDEHGRGNQDQPQFPYQAPQNPFMNALQQQQFGGPPPHHHPHPHAHHNPQMMYQQHPFLPAPFMNQQQMFAQPPHPNQAAPPHGQYGMIYPYQVQNVGQINQIGGGNMVYDPNFQYMNMMGMQMNQPQPGYAVPQEFSQSPPRGQTSPVQGSGGSESPSVIGQNQIQQPNQQVTPPTQIPVGQETVLYQPQPQVVPASAPHQMQWNQNANQLRNPVVAGNMIGHSQSMPNSSHQNQNGIYMLMQQLMTQIRQPTPETKSEETQTDERKMNDMGLSPEFPYQNQEDHYFQIPNIQQRMDPITKAFSIKLQQEIIRIYEDVTEDIKKGAIARDVAFKELENIAQNVLGQQAYLTKFGSQVTGIATDSSDLDVAVRGMNFGGNSEWLKEKMVELYEEIQMQCDQFLIDKLCLTGATVPVIKITIDLQKLLQFMNLPLGDLESAKKPGIKQLKVDISFEDEVQTMSDPTNQHMGVKCVNLIKDLIQSYAQLKPLAIVLKKFLHVVDLNSPYHGGLSSYSLVLMIVSFLQQQQEHAMQNMMDESNLGESLIDFFRFYGFEFDPLSMEIREARIQPRLMSGPFAGLNAAARSFNRTNNLGVPNITSSPGLLQNQDLFIWDCLNQDNNLARSTYKVADIQRVFAKAFDLLSERYEEIRQENLEKEFNLEEVLFDIKSYTENNNQQKEIAQVQ